MPDDKQPTSKELRLGERVYLTIPIRVFATDPRDRDFTEDCVTVDVSRYGTRIRLRHSLTVDDIIRVRNLQNGKEATFVVVERVGSPAVDAAVADWGVEAVDPNVEIWGVELKKTPVKDTAFSAILECNNCHRISSFLLSYSEAQGGGTPTFITRSCPRCRVETTWTFVTSDRRRPKPAGLRPPALGSSETAAERRTSKERREAHRHIMQVPIRIRTLENEVEISRTVALSKQSVRFLGSKDYRLGATLFVAVPYTTGEAPIEVRASVEHIEEVAGSEQKLYGARFERR